MRTLITFFAVVALVAGCATKSTTTTQAPAGNVYSGEVWTWDERENIVTLRQGTQKIRVQVTPDQLIGLRLYQNVTLRGQLAPPATIDHVTSPTGPMVAVPRGSAEQVELSGTVTAAGADGRVTIDSPRGPVHVWVATGAEQRFTPGSSVRLVTTLQPVDMVAADRAPRTEDPAAALRTQPGDYSVVTGRIIGVRPNGGLIVESPTGPLQLWVADSSKYRLSDSVQVRTLLQRAP
jgi:uncharacterized protein YceK